MTHPEFQAEQLQRRFDALKSQWDEETSLRSNTERITGHPAYREIITMGKPAIPLILQDLRREPNHWFHALTELTGVDVAEGEDTLDGATQKWLDWGITKGYISPEPPK